MSNTITTTLSPPLSPPHSMDAVSVSNTRKQCNDSNIKNSSITGGKRRLKVVSACNECRRKKIKCDGKAPCICCIKSNKQGICKYTTAPSNNNNEKLGGGAILPTKGQLHNHNRHHPYQHKQHNEKKELDLPSSTSTMAEITANTSITMIQSIEHRLAAIEDVLQNFLKRHQEQQAQGNGSDLDTITPQLVQKIREEAAEVRRIRLPPLQQYSGFPSSPANSPPPTTENKPRSAFTKPSISNHYPFYSPFSSTSCCSASSSSKSMSQAVTPPTISFGRPNGSSSTLASTSSTTSTPAAGSAQPHYYPHHSYNSVY